MPQVYLGPYARCACCDKTISLRLCSASGPVQARQGTVKISHALLTRIYRDVASGIFTQTRQSRARDPYNRLIPKSPTIHYRFNCLHCGSTSSELYWVEAKEDNWVGGWCKYCLHRHFGRGMFGHPEEGANIDLKILRLNASKRLAGALEAWNEAWQKVKDADEPSQSESSDIEGQLF